MIGSFGGDGRPILSFRTRRSGTNGRCGTVHALAYSEAMGRVMGNGIRNRATEGSADAIFHRTPALARDHRRLPRGRAHALAQRAAIQRPDDLRGRSFGRLIPTTPFVLRASRCREMAAGQTA